MARRKRSYTVRTGDTAATIAKQLGIDPQTLMRANTGVGNLRPGMVLRQPPAQYDVGGNYAETNKGGKVRYSLRPDDPVYPPATQPVPAYTQIAGHGTPTDYSKNFTGQPVAQLADWQTAVRGTNYQSTSVAYQLNQGYSDEQMGSIGFIKYGNTWMRSVEPPGAANGAATGSGGIQPWEERGGPVKRVEDMGGKPGQRTFYTKQESSPSAPGDQTYTAVERYDAYGNLKSRAPAAERPPDSGPRGRGRTGGGSRGGSVIRGGGISGGWNARGKRQEAEAAPSTSEGLESWVNQVTKIYGEDIWTEEKRITPPSDEEGATYDWAAPSYERYKQLELDDPKLGFYDWYQGSQNIFGSAWFDKVMGKTVGGDYATDKAKASFEAYLGFTPDWEEEYKEYAGPARVAGQYSNYDTRGGYTPMTRQYARPNYLGLINWRI